jgi:HEAT repeat protein
VLDPEVRKSTGALVRRVDPGALENLRDELAAPGRSRRIRAVEMAVALEAVVELEPALIALLQDDDHFVRVEVAVALAQSDTTSSREALRESLLDRSVAVQEAAETSLRLLSVPGPRKPRSVSVTPVIDSTAAVAPTSQVQA